MSIVVRESIIRAMLIKEPNKGSILLPYRQESTIKSINFVSLFLGNSKLERGIFWIDWKKKESTLTHASGCKQAFFLVECVGVGLLMKHPLSSLLCSHPAT